MLACLPAVQADGGLALWLSGKENASARKNLEAVLCMPARCPPATSSSQDVEATGARARQRHICLLPPCHQIHLQGRQQLTRQLIRCTLYRGPRLASAPEPGVARCISASTSPCEAGKQHSSPQGSSLRPGAALSFAVATLAPSAPLSPHLMPTGADDSEQHLHAGLLGRSRTSSLSS